jgi:hypothetical protein
MRVCRNPLVIYSAFFSLAGSLANMTEVNSLGREMDEYSIVATIVGQIL